MAPKLIHRASFAQFPSNFTTSVSDAYLAGIVKPFQLTIIRAGTVSIWYYPFGSAVLGQQLRDALADGRRVVTETGLCYDVGQ